MRLLITLRDQDFAHTKSVGILNVSLGLARGLAAHPGVTELHVLANSSLDLSALAGNPRVVLHDADLPAPRKWARVAWDQFGVLSAIRRANPDWALFPKGFPPGLGWPRCRVACYVHDLMWRHYQGVRPNPFPLMERSYFPWLSRRALAKSDLVLTSTHFNVDEIESFMPGRPVVPVGIGFDPRQPLWPDSAVRPSSPDLLVYTSPFPHKLTPQALAWIARWRTAAGHAGRVHVVGGLPTGISLPEQAGWVRHARLKTDALLELRRSCRIAIYFSAYEGFGMPPVECLLEGQPCIASDIPPIRENVPASLLFRNDDFASFSSCISNTLAAGTLPAIAMPTWEAVAARIVTAMQG